MLQYVQNPDPSKRSGAGLIQIRSLCTMQKRIFNDFKGHVNFALRYLHRFKCYIP